MKKILKSWITWAIVAVACFATAYFINANQEPVVETVEVVVEPTIDADSVEVVEIAIEETENEETNVELNTVETNE